MWSILSIFPHGKQTTVKQGAPATNCESDVRTVTHTYGDRWLCDVKVCSFQANLSLWVDPSCPSSPWTPCLRIHAPSIISRGMIEGKKIPSRVSPADDSLLLKGVSHPLLSPCVWCKLGSPKRRQFQRQRAASESMDQDDDTHHIDLIQYIARTQDVSYRPSQPATRLLAAPSTPPPSLGRYL